VFVDIPYQQPGIVAPRLPPPPMGALGNEMHALGPPPPGQQTFASLPRSNHAREQDYNAYASPAVSFSQLQMPEEANATSHPYGYTAQSGQYDAFSMGHPGPPGPVYGYEGQAPQYGRRAKQAP
jgi:hypothetical protein